MVVQARLTVEQFEILAALPENADKRLEFIGGEVIEVVSNNYASQIAARILAKLIIFTETNDLGYITGADGGYKVSGERYIPDVGFISKATQPKRSHETWNPQAPDLAVEVVSPTDSPTDMTDKVANYLLAGTVVWYVYPDKQQVKIYDPQQPVKTLGINDTLTSETVLLGFALALKDIFPTD